MLSGSTNNTLRRFTSMTTASKVVIVASLGVLGLVLVMLYKLNKDLEKTFDEVLCDPDVYKDIL